MESILTTINEYKIIEKIQNQSNQLEASDLIKSYIIYKEIRDTIGDLTDLKTFCLRHHLRTLLTIDQNKKLDKTLPIKPILSYIETTDIHTDSPFFKQINQYVQNDQSLSFLFEGKFGDLIKTLEAY